MAAATHPSEDAAAGDALGQSAADAVIARAMNDRMFAPWPGSVPTGPGMWFSATPPAGPTRVAAGTRIYRAEPRLNIADGAWHDLACARTATRLAITVDGVERAAVPVPASVSIANAEPLRIGGKSPNKGNDQFAGEIDNVFVAIP